jgi:hypothetical protein
LEAFTGGKPTYKKSLLDKLLNIEEIDYSAKKIADNEMF